jgi:hypothetical protein
VYLHFVLDEWIEREVKPRLRGSVFLIRYTVFCFQYREDAEKVLHVLPKRFARFGLTLQPEKTRLVAFGRKALAEASRTGAKPDTFDFLGLTHKCARSRRGKFTVHVKAMKKRLRGSLKGVTEWCRAHSRRTKRRETTGPKPCCHYPVDRQQAALKAKLRGHYQYYGRPTNFRSLWQFYRGVRQTWKKWLGRRTRGRTLTWEKYAQILHRHPKHAPGSYALGPVRQVLPEEPTGVISRGGVCEGRGSAEHHGEPTRARSWKRRAQPRGAYRDRSDSLLLGVAVGTCRHRAPSVRDPSPTKATIVVPAPQRTSGEIHQLPFRRHLRRNVCKQRLRSAAKSSSS